MKFISVILSLYVLLLTFVPCSDAHSNNDLSDCISLIQQDRDQNHSSNDWDLCSPFCYCTCCQSVSHPDLTTLSKVDLVAHQRIIPLIENNTADRVIPFWRPPKV